MSTTITPIVSWTTITAPSGGDTISAYGQQAMAQGLANRIEFLSSSLFSISSSVADEIRGTATSKPLPIGVFSCTGSAGHPTWVASTTGPLQNIVPSDLTALIALFDVDVPHGVTITKLSAYIDPVSGHGALPSQMPVLQLTALNQSGSVTTIINTTDSSATTVAYEANHWIDGTATHVVDNKTYRYQINFAGEGGANALPGMRIRAINITWT